jgi:hypothetical protein
LRAALWVLVFGTACGRTGLGFDLVASQAPTVETAPLVLSLASGTPTSSPNVQLTVADCTGIQFVFVNEGRQPSASEAGWQKCTTTPGGIT